MEDKGPSSQNARNVSVIIDNGGVKQKRDETVKAQNR